MKIPNKKAIRIIKTKKANSHFYMIIFGNIW